MVKRNRLDIPHDAALGERSVSREMLNQPPVEICGVCAELEWADVAGLFADGPGLRGYYSTPPTEWLLATGTRGDDDYAPPLPY